MKPIINALSAFGFWLASRARKRPITTIVLHATAGTSFAGAWSTLRAKGFSYHVLVADENDPQGDGRLIKTVPDSRVAFHAGVSTGPEGSNVNNYSLGLSFVNANDGRDPYSPAQYAAAVQHVYDWAMAYPTIKWLTTHYWISPGRKTDPRGFNVQLMLRDVNARLQKVGRNPLQIWKP